MEKPLKLNGTEDTPQIIFDRDNNQFTIRGRSLPEDSSEFYRPVIAWMEDYSKNPNPYTELNVNLDYFNSSSIKQLLVLFMLLENIIKLEKEVNIVWCYSKDDDIMEIKGKEFKSMLDIPFEMNVC